MRENLFCMQGCGIGFFTAISIGFKHLITPPSKQIESYHTLGSQTENEGKIESELTFCALLICSSKDN